MSRLSQSLHPAYHLRPNKAVDRMLFIELLKILDLKCSLHNHVYIGLGGPYLEDFRLLAQEFPKMKLISVEKDGETHKRQLFHMCSKNMTCFCDSFEKYVATKFPADKPVIVWADYTDVSRQSLSELSDIVRQSIPNSIVRITVRAESPVVGRLCSRNSHYPLSVPNSKKDEFRLIRQKYERDMAISGIAYSPKWFEWPEFSENHFPSMIDKMILAVAEGSCTPPKTFLPLHSVKYSDGSIMLSVTGIVCSKDNAPILSQHFIDKTSFSIVNSHVVDTIDVPTLTTKERLHLEKILPTLNNDGAVALNELGYLIDGDDSQTQSKAKMAQFEKYHRFYPYFGKMIP